MAFVRQAKTIRCLAILFLTIFSGIKGESALEALGSGDSASKNELEYTGTELEPKLPKTKVSEPLSKPFFLPPGYLPQTTPTMCPPLYRMTIGVIAFLKLQNNIYIGQGNTSDLYVPQSPGATFWILCGISPLVDHHSVTCQQNGEWDTTPAICCNGAPCGVFGMVCSNYACVFPPMAQAQSQMQAQALFQGFLQAQPQGQAPLRPIAQIAQNELGLHAKTCPQINGVAIWRQTDDNPGLFQPASTSELVANEDFRLTCDNGTSFLPDDMTCQSDGTWYPEPPACCNNLSCENGGTCVNMVCVCGASWRGKYCEEQIPTPVSLTRPLTEQADTTTERPVQTTSKAVMSLAADFMQYQTKGKAKEVHVPTVPANGSITLPKPLKRRRNAEDLVRVVTAKAMSIDQNSEAFEAVKKTLGDQLVDMISKTGLDISPEDINVASLTPLLSHIASVQAGDAKSGSNKDLAAFKSSIGNVAKQLEADGAFGSSFGRGEISFDLRQLTAPNNHQAKSSLLTDGQAKNAADQVLTTLYHATLITAALMVVSAIIVSCE